jgi:hypothetical protein
MTLSSSSTHAGVCGEPEVPDPDLDDPNEEPDSRDDEDIDALIEDLAASTPVEREALIEVEAALSFVRDRLELDGDALVVLGLALDRIAERHAVVLRHVARAVASLQAERRHPLFEGDARSLEAP